MDNPAAAFTRDSAEGVMNDCTDDTDEDRDTDKDGGSQCSLLFLRTLIPDGSDHQAACKSLVSICVLLRLLQEVQVICGFWTQLAAYVDLLIIDI